MKRKAAIMMVALMTAGLLGACGGKEDSTGSSSSGNTNKESSEVTGTTTSDEETERTDLKDIKVEDYVTLGEYKNIAVTVSAQAQVEDSDVDSNALQLYNSKVTAENGGIMDRAAEDGDTVNIDYEGKKDDVAFQGGTAQNQSLTLGSNSFIDGFEDGLIGVKPGETVDLNLTFPENYQSTELAGAEVVFTVTVNFIYPKDAADMKDEVVAGFDTEDYSNVEELRKYVYNMLAAQNLSTYNSNVRNSIMSTVIENSTFAEELPAALVEQYKTNISNSITSTAAMYGMDADTYLGYVAQTDLETFASVNAENSVKQMLVLKAIADKENMNVEDDAMDDLLSEYAKDQNVESTDQLLEYNSLEEYREYFMMQKITDYLVENAVITEE